MLLLEFTMAPLTQGELLHSRHERTRALLPRVIGARP